MAERRQLPPQIRRVELARRAGSKPVVRYQLTVDTGIVHGKRKQLRRRYRTENEARATLAEVQEQVASGTYVQPSTLTIELARDAWLRSRHKIRPATAAGYEYVLQPVEKRARRASCSGPDPPTHRRSDCEARSGELVRPGGRARKAWSARSCSYMLGALSQVLAQVKRPGVERTEVAHLATGDVTALLRARSAILLLRRAGAHRPHRTETR